MDTGSSREISPYDDAGFREAMPRVLKSPLLPYIAGEYFPELGAQKLSVIAGAMQTVEEFQRRFIGEALRVMLEKTSRGQTIAGVEKLPRGHRYVFISNHRDILLDSALFTRSLMIMDYGTPKICLGDNLLVNPWITDLVKMNKGVTVKRNLSQRELFKWSGVLSSVIRDEVESGRDSVWIAQSEGRAKDGNDRTHPGVLKMLSLSGEGAFLDKLGALNIVPVAISFEYDPCDIPKARELALTEAHGSYRKAPGEDVQSIREGIVGQKGRIHIEVGSPIVAAIAEARALPSKNEQAQHLARALDVEIHRLYRLFPSNYIAFDDLEGRKLNGHYSAAERDEFFARLDARIAKLKDAPELAARVRRFALEAYANPVRNRAS